MLKFMYSKKATKFDKIFNVDLTLCSQIDNEYFANLCGLFRKHELYSLAKWTRTFFLNSIQILF